jgi:hypothetical protein
MLLLAVDLGCKKAEAVSIAHRRTGVLIDTSVANPTHWHELCLLALEGLPYCQKAKQIE